MANVYTATHAAKLLAQAIAEIGKAAVLDSGQRRFYAWTRAERLLEKVCLFVASEKRRAWVEWRAKQERLGSIAARAVAR